MGVNSNTGVEVNLPPYSLKPSLSIKPGAYSGDALPQPSEAGTRDGSPHPPGISIVPGDENSGPHTCLTSS